MSNRLLSDIYNETIKQITETSSEWERFIRFFTVIHKYPFDQAVLVYAQNKNVTMIAAKEIWSKLNRSITPKSKAIQVIKYIGGEQKTEYLFDISQTSGAVLQRPKWAIQEDREYIYNALSNVEGVDLESKLDNYTNLILNQVYLDIEDHIDEAFDNLGSNVEKENAINMLTKLASESAQLMVRSKSELDINEVDFSEVTNFKSFKQVLVLGHLVSETAKTVLSEIATFKKEYSLEKENKNAELQNERRRESLSRDTSKQQGNSTTRQVGKNSIDLPTREQSVEVSGVTDERNTDREDASNSGGSERTSVESNEGIREETTSSNDRGYSRENETQKSIEGTGRGDSNTELHISSSIDIKTEPVSEIETGFFDGEQLELFNDWDVVGNSNDDDKVVPTQAEIDAVIKVGSLFENGKHRIYEFFSSNPTSSEAVSFLKKEYGIGGSSGGKLGVSFSFDSKGLTLRKGSYLDPTYEVTLKWNQVSKRIQELIRYGQYLTEEEKIQSTNEKNKVENTLEENTLVVENSKEVSDSANNQQVESIPVVNFRYDESEELYSRGDKTKYQDNVAAIRLLKELERENRPVTSEDQKVLAKYVGWGGLANVFNPDNDKWREEYKELKALLSDSEYRDAMESTITAYYTDQAIIKEMYRALDNFGFEKGKILDPAMGTGNFFSIIPEKLVDNTEMTGIELDSITGRIAKQLYPNANIYVQGYESTKFKENEFDVVIGNIPFNNIKISDPQYDKHKFLIHDYFIAKSLDVVKSGGIVAFITSKGTLDKSNKKVREYIAERAELLGAIRLPNNAFKNIAGTEVTTDIIFLKKRDNLLDLSVESSRPEWLETDKIPGSIIEINKYFLNHPEMLLGDMQFDGFYNGSQQVSCVPKDGQDLMVELKNAIDSVKGEFTAIPTVAQEKEVSNDADYSIDAPTGTKNYTYVVFNNKLHFNENGKLIPQNLGKMQTDRIIGLCEIRDALQDVIKIQAEGDYNESELKDLQTTLNKSYDKFVKKYGYINDRANQKAFYEDDQLPLLLSIEDEQKDKTYKKAPIFYKATIRPKVTKDYAQSAQEALEMSLNFNMKVDLHYMAKIYDKDIDSIINELGNEIYLNPMKYHGDNSYGWEYKDEYLSGNVREKLDFARLMAKKEPNLFSRNVEALESVQPTPLLPGEINYRIGSPWIPREYYEQFMYNLLETSNFAKEYIKIQYSSYTNTWSIEKKGYEPSSVKVNSVYGTGRRNAYQIIEDCLNLQDSTIRDPKKYLDHNGDEKIKYVVNAKETMLARAKQQEIQEAFKNWLFDEPERSETLLNIYNERFNSIRPRTYNGENLTFPEMNEELELRPHQRNAVARVIATGNGLLAHEVGAGKTAAMIAAGMKLRQIGAIKKPMFVVMNHTVDQWAKEFMRFYPNANVLITTKKDFQKMNRKRFVSKIATGDYDAIIIGHSQFERIQLSKERQENMLRKEINSLTYEISQAKKEEGRDWSVKQLVIFQRKLEDRLKKLQNESKKDNVLTFEELGVDSLFVDEAHVYKNLYTVTKLTNVAGIGTSSSQRASDLKLKCEYIQEMNDGRGIVFATGTPVTNSMSELFVMQRFLQPNELNKAGLDFFDNWAGTFGEVVTSLEITPEGSGYRMKSRFAKFHNLPELMNMFNMVADIQTQDMLNLPVPELDGGKANIIVSESSEFQRAMMDEFVERSEQIRNAQVNPSVDNMLKLTHEAKLMAIDPRLIDENAPVDEDTKLNKCIDNVYRIWKETEKDRLTQMIFSDSGTPNPNRFNVYDEIKSQLIKKGVPAQEVAFIHDAKTDAQRDALFAKMKKGDVRVLIGSTSKVGTGTNVQDLLIAGHHIDCPWRPADLTQRDGRIIRQGNKNEKVSIYRYVTKGTFDSYLWQIQEQKLRYISQVMTGKNISRSCDDTDEVVLTAAEVKAIATDNPLLLEKMTLDNEVNRLQLIKNRWSNEKAIMQKNVNIIYPNRIEKIEKRINAIENDVKSVSEYPEAFKININGLEFTDEKEAGEALRAVIKIQKSLDENLTIIGEYKGQDIFVRKNAFNEILIGLKRSTTFEVPFKISDVGNIQRLSNITENYNLEIEKNKLEIEDIRQQIKTTEAQLQKPFAYEDQLNKSLREQQELNLKLEFADQIKQEEKDKKAESITKKVKKSKNANREMGLSF